MSKICGIDPGNTGAISIIDGKSTPKVYPMPIIVEKKKGTKKGSKKTKKSYDLLEIRKILSENLDKNDKVYIERVATRPGEGSVSSFSFGKGVGDLEGVVVGLFNFLPDFVSPVTWKKKYPELINEFMEQKKEEIKKIKLGSKTLKDKDLKKANEKEINRLNSQVKTEAKKLARELVSNLYPEIASLFKKANSDGMAESILIALYGEKQEK